MDGTATTLKEKLEQLLREAAEVSVALDRADGTIVGVPHYSVIEARAHELGQQLSRQIQAQQLGEFAVLAALLRTSVPSAEPDATRPLVNGVLPRSTVL